MLVGDIRRSVAFYSRLGFEIKYASTDGEFVELTSKAGMIALRHEPRLPDSVRSRVILTRRRQTLLWTGSLMVMLAAAIIMAVGQGPVGIPPWTVARIIGQHALGVPADTAWTIQQDNLVWLVREARVLLAVVVGAALAATGVAIQPVGP